MNYDDEFFTKIYHLSLINRIKFSIYIWKDGKFQSTLQNLLQIPHNNLSNKESIEKYAEHTQKLGFLTIIKRMNPHTQKEENFYLISDENFMKIFLHLCQIAHIAYDLLKYNLIFNDRMNVKADIINDIQNRLKNDKLLNEKKLIMLLNKNLGYFFLFIMKCSSTMNKHDDELFHFYNEVTVRLSVPAGTFVSRNIYDLIDVD